MSDWDNYNGDPMHDMYTDSMYGEGPHPFGEGRSGRASYGQTRYHYGSAGGDSMKPTVDSKIARCEYRIKQERSRIANARGRAKSMKEWLSNPNLEAHLRERYVRKLKDIPAVIQNHQRKLDKLQEKLIQLTAEKEHDMNVAVIVWGLVITAIVVALVFIFICVI